MPAAEDAQLPEYTVLDDVIVAPEYERYVIVRWGDRVYPDKDDYFGFNCDYTAFVPIRKRDDDDDDEKERGERGGYLWVNHEYVSYPFSTLAPATAAGLFNTPTTHEAVLGFSLPSGNASAEKLKDRLAGLTADERRLLIGEFHYNQVEASL